MDLGPLQESHLDSDFSWEIKTIVFVLYSLEIKESGPSKYPPLMVVGPLQDIKLDTDFIWEIKTIVFVSYSLEIKESGPSKYPPWWT